MNKGKVRSTISPKENSAKFLFQRQQIELLSIIAATLHMYKNALSAYRQLHEGGTELSFMITLITEIWTLIATTMRSSRREQQ